ncbi:MAG: transketolase family protein [Thermoplasmatota archaeon]
MSMNVTPYAERTHKKSLRDAASQVLIEIGRNDPNVVVLDADLALSTKTIRFGQMFPDRFFDMGISEQNMMGVAAGFAAAGKKAVAATFATFATGQCYNVIRQSIAYANHDVTIYATHAGISVGGDGATHQMLEDIGLMRMLPNMWVFAPADATEMDPVLQAAVARDGPCYVRCGRSDEPVLFERYEDFKVGKGLVLTDAGSDLNIVSTGSMTRYAIEAVEALRKDGLDVGHLHMPTIKPMDDDALETFARASGALVTAEEHNVIGGFGSACLESLAKRYPVPVRRVGTQDTFGESGSGQALMDKYGLSAGHIATYAKEAMGLKDRTA